MSSKWFNLKNQACQLRHSGVSIRVVEKKLGIPRSTLSYWFKNIRLNSKQLRKLKMDWVRALVKARKKAIVWHNKQKSLRLRVAEQEARQVLSKLNLSDLNILDLAFAMLYLGEGFKGTGGTAVGNSDPRILKFFVTMLHAHGVEQTKIKCELHLRADQNPLLMKRYWAKELGLPLLNFKSVSLDKRTEGSPTYPYYKGVCVVRCGRIALQRKLVYLSQIFCDKVSERFNTGG